jgi:antitoxin HicB
MQRFPARFTAEPDGGYSVTFRDIPEAITQGDTLDEAREAARDALATALEFYLEDHRAVPTPSRTRSGEELVSLPISKAAKAMLLNEMISLGLRPIDLAQAMEVPRQEVNRILDLNHQTKIDTLERAFAAIGRTLQIHLA